MTNKPMLSVERELLERITRPQLKRRDETVRRRAITELRAILDKPAKPTPECVGDLERFEADDGVFVRLGDVIDMLANEKAARHQGEPPLIATLHENGELIAAQATIAQQAKLIYLLRAGHQPAPLAVVMPGGFMIAERCIWTEEQAKAAGDTITLLKNVPGMTDRDLGLAAADAAQCKAPDISLDDVARLNGVNQ